jgi:homocysteine S-methyltransferase
MPVPGISPGQGGRGRGGSDFVDALASGVPILTEGAVVERIRRGGEAPLDPFLANASLVLEERGRAVLERIYVSYLDVACRHRLPLLLLTPTWRANPERMRLAGISAGIDLNGEAVRFLSGIRDRSGAGSRTVFVGGLLGCRGDAYRPEEGLPATEAEAFHRTQAAALAAAGVDFLLASTMPALPEAIGMARALSAAGPPYLISFIVRENGRLLDGTPLDEAIDTIDRAASPPPAAFLVNCVHPDLLRRALSTPQAAGSTRLRLAGLQANASRLSPEELDGRADLDTSAPGSFSDAMGTLRDRFGLRVLGGCCGTDETHVEALAGRLSQSPIA